MSENTFNTLLKKLPIILLDGAMGTMLIQKGMKPGECPEAWNVENPEAVRVIHRAYIQAGSRLILTNSFGGTQARLKRHQDEKKVHAYNLAAARNARAEADAAAETVVVGGSMGPLGALIKPYGPLEAAEARENFKEQAQALAEGGVDVFWIETMSDLNEIQAAYEGIRSFSKLPVVASLSFDMHGKTMMGVSPAAAVSKLKDLDLAAAGSNCGKGPQDLLAAVGEMVNAGCRLPLVAKANAGLPKLVEGEVVYDGTPQVMADYARQARAQGARLIGACCGSTPEHIRAMADALI